MSSQCGDYSYSTHSIHEQAWLGGAIGAEGGGDGGRGGSRHVTDQPQNLQSSEQNPSIPDEARNGRRQWPHVNPSLLYFSAV